MAGLCEGGSEPQSSLKAIWNRTRPPGFAARRADRYSTGVDWGGESTAQIKGMGHLIHFITIVSFLSFKLQFKAQQCKMAVPAIHMDIADVFQELTSDYILRKEPKKSTTRASRELNIPQPTVWRVLKHRLHMKPYKLQLLQALHPDDHNNDTIPGRWIGRGEGGGGGDQLHRRWPPRSPDLTPCDFYLWGYVKDRVFIPSMPDIGFNTAINSPNAAAHDKQERQCGRDWNFYTDCSKFKLSSVQERWNCVSNFCSLEGINI
ncbi:hypothetical protein ANN_16807 [Periplaneta americana]|uniref:HTH psq-type domain-containing protein n=1 Tax=Periplaneta americana TaxID=6978 RepID=A0ABQ8SR55_PERAM|nr:hypothetical protein ANN_16807 [Periplaneta americana]